MTRTKLRSFTPKKREHSFENLNKVQKVFQDTTL